MAPPDDRPQLVEKPSFLTRRIVALSFDTDRSSRRGHPFPACFTK
jgi:hypothetical protein